LGPLKHFRLLIVRLSIALTLATGAAAYFLISDAAGIGLLLGGLGATLAFWIMATRVEKLATIPKEKIQSSAFRWTFVRLLIYGLVLYRAYLLDSEHLHGLLAALGGLFLHRAVLIGVALTGADLRQED